MRWRERDITWKVDPTSHLPLWVQLRRQIEASIFTGELNIGDRLPTVRAVAVALKINANTVAKVYRALETEGILRTRRGSGTYVAAGMRRIRLGLNRNRRLRMWVRSLLAQAEEEAYTREEFVREALRQTFPDHPPTPAELWKPGPTPKVFRGVPGVKFVEFQPSRGENE